MKCRLRRKAEQALFDVHHRIVDRGRPRMAGSGMRARAGTEGPGNRRCGKRRGCCRITPPPGRSRAAVVLAVTQASGFPHSPRNPETPVTEACEVEPGSGE